MMDSALSGSPLSGGYTRYGFLLLWPLHDLSGLPAGATAIRSQSQPSENTQGGDAHAHALSGQFLVVPHLIALHWPELDYTPM